MFPLLQALGAVEISRLRLVLMRVFFLDVGSRLFLRIVEMDATKGVVLFLLRRLQLRVKLLNSDCLKSFTFLHRHQSWGLGVETPDFGMEKL